MRLQAQAESFMLQIQNRRRDPIRANTLRAYRYRLDTIILPRLGEKPVSAVENGVVKDFIAEISAELAPTTVTAVLSLLKAVVASAVDENGNQLYPRTWNHDFMDVPSIKAADLDAPVLGREDVQRSISRALGADKGLYAILAGTGLRIGEALVLATSGSGGNLWSPGEATIRVNSTLVGGTLQPMPKTDAGARIVDLSPELNSYLGQTLGSRPGFLFGRGGNAARVMTAYAHLKAAGIETGFHAFRRFRVTHLESQNVPRTLVQFWTGHAAADITDRYVKIGSDISARKDWAARAGLGFEIPA